MTSPRGSMEPVMGQRFVSTQKLHLCQLLSLLIIDVYAFQINKAQSSRVLQRHVFSCKNNYYRDVSGQIKKKKNERKKQTKRRGEMKFW